MKELADKPLRVDDEAFYRHWFRMAHWFANLRLVSRYTTHYEALGLPFYRVYRRFYKNGLTRAGKALIICSLLVFAFSYRASSGYVLASAALGCSLLAWSALLSTLYRPRVSIQRQYPDIAIAGQDLVSQITLVNVGSRTLHNFTVRELIVPRGRWPQEWQRPHRAALAPGQSETLNVAFEPQKRGMVELTGVAVHSYFPFFLTRSTQRLASEGEVCVLPPTLKVAVPSLRHIAERASKQLADSSDNSRNGPSMEYAYSRQYQTGDSLRRLDHRASSRRGEPMTKIFEGNKEIRRDQVHLIVDASLEGFEPWQRRPINGEALEQRLALAVEIGLSAQNEGFTLAAVATAGEWQPIENLLGFYRCIAECEPQRVKNSHGAYLPRSLLVEEGLYIFVVGRWDQEVQSRVEGWRSSGVLVLVFLLAESAEQQGKLPVGSQFVEVTGT